jgi:hypothetical protein
MLVKPTKTAEIPESDPIGFEHVPPGRTYGSDPGPLAARYVQACHSQSWHFATWSRSDAAKPVEWQPMRCCSWRHEGPCQDARAAQDYARIKAALEKHDRANVCYLVLTLDPSAWTGSGWAGWDGETPERRSDATKDSTAISAAYAALGDRWRMFAQAFRREVGKFQYVSTVESHRSGWPHLNVIIVSEELAKLCQVAEMALTGWEKNARGRETARRVLGKMLQRTGFGPIAFLEAANRKGQNGRDLLASYIAKLASSTGQPWDGESRGLFAGEKVSSIDGQVIAEIAKHSQAPHRAGDHFRRLRSSKGFLPAIERDPDRTGGIFDAGYNPIGSLKCDDILEDAKCSNPETDFQRVMARIGEELTKLDTRPEFVGDTTGAIIKKQTRIIKTLLLAAKIMHGHDPEQRKREEEEWERKISGYKEKAIITERKRRLAESKEHLRQLMRDKGIAI